MEIVKNKISQKLARNTSVLYQAIRPTDDYHCDYSSFWISAMEFEQTQENYPYFSQKLLISGMLFIKRKKTDRNRWFRAKFFGLFKDYLVLYSVPYLKKNILMSRNTYELNEKLLVQAEDANIQSNQI